MIFISKPILDDKEITEVVKVLKSGVIVQGPKVEEFEKKFAKKFGVKYAVAFNSGTAALHSALWLAGIREGDEVITTPFTFVATANAIMMCGAKPVFVDICEEDFNLDSKLIEKKITPKTRVILPVDLYGQTYNMEEINKIAKKYKLKIIEDACQAHGAKFRDKYAGTLGDIGIFSFYATKNMVTGEGGMMITNSKRYADLARQFRHHGRDLNKNYEYLDLGFNYRMTDIAAAIGIEQLKKLDLFNDRRIKNAQQLTSGLKEKEGIIIPKTIKGRKHVFHQYTIRIMNSFKLNRNQLQLCLKRENIASGVYYPKPLHLHKNFRTLGYKKGDFPVSEKLSKEVLSLPVHPLLKAKDIKKIINTIRKI